MSRFKVVGNHAVKGVAPGKTGESDDEDWVDWAERAGHIRVVGESRVFPKTAKKQKDAD